MRRGATGPTDQADEIPLLRYRDTLADDGARVVRALAEEPRAVILDLTGTDRGDLGLSGSFDAVERYLASWSATPLLVVAAEPWLLHAVREHPLGGRTTTWPSTGSALAAARRHPRAVRSMLHLDPVTAAPGRSRRFVRATLMHWGCGRLVEAATSVSSELVTNAVTHASSPIVLTLSRAPGGPRQPVRVAVRDSNDTAALLARAAPMTEGDPGLSIVEATARSWGWTALQVGRVVWAVLDSRTNPHEP